MNSNKIIRSVCYFSEHPQVETIKQVDAITKILTDSGYIVQTKRICSPDEEKIRELDTKFTSEGYIFTVGSIKKEGLLDAFPKLTASRNTSFNLDLTKKEITLEDVRILFDIIKNKPSKTFNFTYVFNNPPSSPYFPSGTFGENEAYVE